MKRDVLARREQAVPAGARDRVLEEDAAADVRVDQPLVPARGIAERIVPALPDPDGAEKRAQVTRAKRQDADRDCDRRRRRERDGALRGHAPRDGGRDDRPDGEVQPEQSGQRGSENDADGPGDPGHQRQATETVRGGEECGQPDCEHHRGEGREIVLAEEGRLSARREARLDEGGVEEGEQAVADRHHCERDQHSQQQPELQRSPHEEHEAEREHAVLEQLDGGRHRLCAVRCRREDEPEREGGRGDGDGASGPGTLPWRRAAGAGRTRRAPRALRP